MGIIQQQAEKLVPNPAGNLIMHDLDRTILCIRQTLVCTQRPTFCQVFVQEKNISMSSVPFFTWHLIWLQQMQDLVNPGPAVHLELLSKYPGSLHKAPGAFLEKPAPPCTAQCCWTTHCQLQNYSDPAQALPWTSLQADGTRWL